MRNNPTALPIVFGSNKYYENTIRLWFILADEIQPEKLRKAVNLAIKRFPHFSIEIIKDDSDVFPKIIPNNSTIVITEGIESPLLMSEEANRHLLTINYDKNDLYLDCHHLMCDGISLSEISKTILYYYFKEVYVDLEKPETVKTLEDPIKNEELNHPYLNLEGKRNPLYDKPFLPSKEFNLLDDGVPMVGKQSLYRLVVDEKDFINLCRSLNSNPSSLLTTILAKTIYNTRDRLDKNFRINTVYSTRPFIEKPDALDYLINDYDIVFTPYQMDWNLEDLVAIVRGRSVIEMDPDRVLEKIKNNIAKYNEILSLNKLEDIIEASKTDHLNHITTGIVSYIGETIDLGNYNKYLKEAYVFLQSGPLIGIEAFLFNGKFYISFLQGFSDETYVKEYIRILEENKVSVEFKGRENIYYPKSKLIF